MSSQLLYPVIAFSPAGWTKEAACESDLTDADPSDDLGDWQGLVIYDAAGHRRVARRAFRAWPRSRIGAYLCGLLGHCVYVGFELTEPVSVSVEELKAKIESIYGQDPSITAAVDHRQLIDLCL